jgi:hypothetical protein
MDAITPKGNLLVSTPGLGAVIELSGGSPSPSAAAAGSFM